MICHLCSAEHSRIVRTLYGKDVTRVRQCNSCGHRWKTIEVDAETVKRAREVQAKVKAIAETVL